MSLLLDRPLLLDRRRLLLGGSRRTRRRGWDRGLSLTLRGGNSGSRLLIRGEGVGGGGIELLLLLLLLMMDGKSVLPLQSGKGGGGCMELLL